MPHDVVATYFLEFDPHDQVLPETGKIVLGLSSRDVDDEDDDGDDDDDDDDRKRFRKNKFWIFASKVKRTPSGFVGLSSKLNRSKRPNSTRR